MRMWMVDPKLMCRKHLLGEHVELHMIVGAINKGKSLEGFLVDNMLEPRSIIRRHEELAEEMARRGYNHKSPLLTHLAVLPSSVWLGNIKKPSIEIIIDRNAAHLDLINRCEECHNLYVAEETRE